LLLCLLPKSLDLFAALFEIPLDPFCAFLGLSNVRPGLGELRLGWKVDEPVLQQVQMLPACLRGPTTAACGLLLYS
jgi:hypothetical protein